MFVLAADCLQPIGIALPMIDSCHRPGPRQCIVNYRSLVPEDVRVRLIQKYALLHDGRVVRMKWNTAAVVASGTPLSRASRRKERQMTHRLWSFPTCRWN